MGKRGKRKRNVVATRFTYVKTTLQSVGFYANSRTMKTLIALTFFSSISAAAINTGVLAVPEKSEFGYSETNGTNQNTEILSYDSGIMGYSICWYNGRDHWVGNDFDVSIYSDVNSMIIRTRDDWPNDEFDGFYIRILDDDNGLPGDIIWPVDDDDDPKYYVSPNEIQANYSDGWVDIDVGYSVDTDIIYACMEQYHSHPDADPFCVDDNPVDQGHSWEDSGNGWRPMDTGDLGDITNNNLMLRLRATFTKGIEVTSIGKIKALYR